jgi:hyaluronoglucosaminidase
MAGKENYVNVYKGFYIGEVLPTPKKIRYTGSYLPIYKGKEKKSTACIVVGKNASNIERLAAMELSAQTGYLLSERNETNSPLLKIQDTSKDIDNYDVIISIGQINTNKLNARYNEKYGLNVTVNYPGKEGYIVKTIKENGKTFIFCIGSDARGSYYAIQSILQLMNKQGSDIVLKESEIVDWPSFKIRGAFEEYAGLFSPLRYRYYELAQWLPKYKLNTFAFGRARKGENWRKPKKEYLDFIKKVCSYAKATQALDVLFMVRPYRRYSKDHRAI